MAFLRRSNRPVLPLLIAVCCSSAWALPQSTLASYTAHLEALRGLLENCRANAAACDASKVGSDEQVNLAGLNAGANVNSFEAHYDWLRGTLTQAHDPTIGHCGPPYAACEVKSVPLFALSAVRLSILCSVLFAQVA